MSQLTSWLNSLFYSQWPANADVVISSIYIAQSDVSHSFDNLFYFFQNFSLIFKHFPSCDLFISKKKKEKKFQIKRNINAYEIKLAFKIQYKIRRDRIKDKFSNKKQKKINCVCVQNCAQRECFKLEKWTTN